jgi:hypothetical protein
LRKFAKDQKSGRVILRKNQAKGAIMKVNRVDTWAASIVDRPGALAAKLKGLSDAGVNLEFVIARRNGDKKGVVFVTPIFGSEQIGAAAAAGFTKTDSLHTLRIEGSDKPGQGSRLLSALADAGLNLRGVSAAAIDKQFVCHVAFDTEADVVRAERIARDL